MISRSYVPADVLHDKRLTATEKLAYGAIYGFRDRDKIAHFSNAALVEPLGVSVRTIERIIIKLVTLNYISVEGTQRNRVLRIIMHPIPYPETTNEHDIGVALSTTLVSQSDPSTTSGVVSTTSGVASTTSGVNLTTSYNKDPNKDLIKAGEPQNGTDIESSTEEIEITPLMAQVKRFIEINSEGKGVERKLNLEQICAQFDLSEEHANTNLHIQGGKLPLKRYPSIWLTMTEAVDIFDQYQAAGIPKQEIKRAFKAVEARLKDPQSYYRPGRPPSAYIWLTSWAKKQVVDELSSETRLKRETAYLNKAG